MARGIDAPVSAVPEPTAHRSVEEIAVTPKRMEAPPGFGVDSTSHLDPSQCSDVACTFPKWE